MRVVLLNGLPLSAIMESDVCALEVKRVSVDELKTAVSKGAESYIRHPATVKVLNNLGINIQPSKGIWKYKQGDLIYVITLKKPVRGEEVEDITIEDLDVFRVKVLSGWYIDEKNNVVFPKK